MRKAALMTFACVFALAAGAVQMASQPWVTNRIAEAEARMDVRLSVVTNAIPKPDYTSSNATLRATIKTVAPAPGDYATVSNRAVNAVQTYGGSATNLQLHGELWIWDSYDPIAPLVIHPYYSGDYFWFANGKSEPETRRVYVEFPNDQTDAYVAYKHDIDAATTAATNALALAVEDGSILAAAAQSANYANAADTSLEAMAAQRLVADGQQPRTAATIFNALDAVQPLPKIVNAWEGYWGGTNVELQVTNYYGNTTGTLPRLRIREFRDGGWTNVWDEVDKFNVCESNLLAAVAASNANLRAGLRSEFAPIAWGTVTDKGATNVVGNSTYMTSPETWFGGGTEFQRVAVGSGAVCVLVDRGALSKTTGEPGTFRFQDAGGTNYFGFVKSDSYTIGCRTDGITVSGNLVTLRYDVIMAGTDVPVVYWTDDLRTGLWTQLNNVDGTAADGAPYAVTWYEDGGSYYAAINVGSSPGGFFKAETAVAGDVMWETNMRARLGGGIECTNTATHATGVIRPKYNGSTVTWEWSAR